MDYEVIWTEPALDDFGAAVRYLDARSPGAAEALRLEILAAVERLVRLPLLGAVYERDPSGRTREVLCGRYRVLYRADESAGRVEVITVWHSGRGEPRLRG